MQRRIGPHGDFNLHFVLEGVAPEPYIDTVESMAVDPLCLTVATRMACGFRVLEASVPDRLWFLLAYNHLAKDIAQEILFGVATRRPTVLGVSLSEKNVTDPLHYGNDRFLFLLVDILKLDNFGQMLFVRAALNSALARHVV